MKRGFLNSAKAKRTPLGPESSSTPESLQSNSSDNGKNTDGRYIHLSHEEVKEADKPQGYKPGISMSGMKEHDDSALSGDPSVNHWTTIPIRRSHFEAHTAAERRDQWTEAIVDGATKRQIFTQPGFPKPIERPSTVAHRVGSSPGKGLGIFAARAIKAGELILAERPLLLVPRSMPFIEGLPAHFTHAQQLQICMAEWEKKLEMAFNRMDPERQEAFMKLQNCHERDGSGPILGRVRTNGIGASGLYYQGEQGLEGLFSVTCELISRLNHSCITNAAYAFDRLSFSARLHALRDIKAGEEIFVTYIDLKAATYAQRQQALAPYGVACSCNACAAKITTNA